MVAEPTGRPLPQGAPVGDAKAGRRLRVRLPSLVHDRIDCNLVERTAPGVWHLKGDVQALLEREVASRSARTRQTALRGQQCTERRSGGHVPNRQRLFRRRRASSSCWRGRAAETRTRRSGRGDGVGGAGVPQIMEAHAVQAEPFAKRSNLSVRMDGLTGCEPSECRRSSWKLNGSATISPCAFDAWSFRHWSSRATPRSPKATCPVRPVFVVFSISSPSTKDSERAMVTTDSPSIVVTSDQRRATSSPARAPVRNARAMAAAIMCSLASSAAWMSLETSSGEGMTSVRSGPTSAMAVSLGRPGCVDPSSLDRLPERGREYSAPTAGRRRGSTLCQPGGVHPVDVLRRQVGTEHVAEPRAEPVVNDPPFLRDGPGRAAAGRF